jgi:lauroyl/myristoyl acyltransferase
LYKWIGKLTGKNKLWKLISWLCRFLPQKLLLALCRTVGFLLYAVVDSKLKERIAANMNEMLGTMHPSDHRKQVRAYFNNVVITLYELLIDVNRLEETKNWRFITAGETYLRKVLKEGKGAIIYTPHIGNFFYAYWYLSRSYDCLTVATASSPELNPIYMKFKEMGCKGFDYDTTPKLELLRAMKNHLADGGVLFILGDFYRTTFPVTRFFDRETRLPAGAASLALEQQVPILPFYMFRHRGFQHRLVFGTPIRLHEMFHPTEKRKAAEHLNKSMENAIRTVPEHWFYWFNANERWIEADKRIESM